MLITHNENLIDDVANILINLFEKSDQVFLIDNTELYPNEIFRYDGFLPVFIFQNLNNITRFSREFLSRDSHIFFNIYNDNESIVAYSVNAKFFSYNKSDYFMAVKFIVSAIMNNPLFKNKRISLNNSYDSFFESIEQIKAEL